MDILNKVKSILFEPKKFFTKLQKEKGIRDVFKYLAIVALFSVILTFIMSLIFSPVQTSFIEQLTGQEISTEDSTPTYIDAIINYLGTLLLSFVIVGILHLWLKLFRGKAKYEKTYQLYIYGTTPTFLFSWIPFIGGFAWIYDLILLIIGTSIIYKLSRTKSILVYLIPLIILIMLLLIAMILLITISANNPGALESLNNL